MKRRIEEERGGDKLTTNNKLLILSLASSIFLPSGPNTAFVCSYARFYKKPNHSTSSLSIPPRPPSLSMSSIKPPSPPLSPPLSLQSRRKFIPQDKLKGKGGGAREEAQGGLKQKKKKHIKTKKSHKPTSCPTSHPKFPSSPPSGPSRCSRSSRSRRRRSWPWVSTV